MEKLCAVCGKRIPEYFDLCKEHSIYKKEIWCKELLKMARRENRLQTCLVKDKQGKIIGQREVVFSDLENIEEI
jgi:hypothetical protein